MSKTILVTAAYLPLAIACIKRVEAECLENMIAEYGDQTRDRDIDTAQEALESAEFYVQTLQSDTYVRHGAIDSAEEAVRAAEAELARVGECDVEELPSWNVPAWKIKTTPHEDEIAIYLDVNEVWGDGYSAIDVSRWLTDADVPHQLS